MKKILLLKFFSFFIILSICGCALDNYGKNSITFTKEDQYLDIKSTSYHDYLINVTFNPSVSDMKYIYFYPMDYYNSEGIRFFFANNTVKGLPNYLNSLYSSIKMNTGIYIRLSEFKASGDVKALIGIKCEEYCDFKFHYLYTKSIELSKGNSKFILPSTNNKNSPLKINLNIIDINAYTMLTILSEATIKKFDVKFTYKKKDITKDISGPYFPNGFGVGFRPFTLEDVEDNDIIQIEIINNYGTDEFIWTSLQLDQGAYFEMVLGESGNLIVSPDRKKTCIYEFERKNNILYIDTYSRNFNFDMTYSDDIGHAIGNYKVLKHSYHYPYNTGVDNALCFSPKNKNEFSSLFFQYFFYTTDLALTQPLLEPLISGYPKHYYIIKDSALYHWLPKSTIKNRFKKIHYHLIPKLEKLTVSFTKCKDFPYNCYFTINDSQDLSPIQLMKNIGLYYTETIQDNILQLILISCSVNCEYDIIMTYDNEPYVMYPNTNFTRFINDNQNDIYELPVPIYLKNESSNIYIELSCLNGKVDLYLYEDIKLTKEITNVNYTEINKKQYMSLDLSILQKQNYLDKQIYAAVKGSKDSFYNIKYRTINETTSKVLINNQINIESLIVGKEPIENKKSFTFINPDYEAKEKSPFYILIDSSNCESTVIINGDTLTGYKHTITIPTTDSLFNNENGYTFEIYLNNDENNCIEGKESIVTMIGYSKNNNEIIISDNTFINTSFVDTQCDIKYSYLFKTNNQDSDEIIDNSINVDLTKYGGNQKLTVSYSLELINPANNTNKPILISKKDLTDSDYFTIDYKYISDFCGNTGENDICHLSIYITGSGINFGLFISRNDYNFPRLLLDNEYLINPIISNKYQYHYFNLDKRYDNNIVINTFGQNLLVYTKLITSKSFNKEADYNRVIILPNKDNVEDTSPKFDYYTKKITINKSILSNCKEICQLYVGIYSPPEYLSQLVTKTFYSIYYSLVDSTTDESKSIINLPINRYIQDSFTKSKGERYYLVNLNYISDPIELDLNAIGKNEEDDSTITAYININREFPNEKDSDFKLISTDKKLTIQKNKINEGKYLTILLKFTSKQTNPKISYKFRVYSNPIKPIDTNQREYCTISKAEDLCYYMLKIKTDNPLDNINIYVPDDEKALIYSNVVSIKEYESSVSTGINGLLPTKSKNNFTSYSQLVPTNFLQHKLPKYVLLDAVVIIGVTSSKVGTFSVLTTPYESSSEDYLQQNETKIYSIKSFNKIKKITIHTINNNKDKMTINIKAIKGDGYINIKDKKYSLGYNINGKDNLNIISHETTVNIIFELNDFESNEFTFSINYILSSKKQLINNLDLGKVNSFNYINENSNQNIYHFLKVNFTKNDEISEKNDISANIKIYCSSCKYNIKGYIVDEGALNSANADSNIDFSRATAIEKQKINNIIEGYDSSLGNARLYNIYIDSSKIKSFNSQRPLYVCIVLVKEKNDDSMMKIEILPYDMTNNMPLVKDQIYIQKVNRKNENNNLLLIKSDVSYSQMGIEFVHPGNDKYDIAISQLTEDNIDSEIDSNDTYIGLQDKLEYGKHSLTLQFNEKKDLSRYLIFNIMSLDDDKSGEDYFVFRYKSNYLLKKEFYLENSTVGYSRSGEEVTFKFKPIESTSGYTYKIKYIANVYDKNTFSKGLNNINDLDMYLSFKGVNPVASGSIIVDEYKSNIELKVENVEDKELYAAITGIVINNEKEEIFGYKPAKVTSGNSAISSYFSDHWFSAILIIAITVFVIAIMCLVCKADKSENGPKGTIEIEMKKEE